MKWLGALFRRIRSLFAPRRWFRSTAWVAEADELPEQMHERTVYLVGTRQRRKWAAFVCPCCSGHTVTLNLQPSRYPFWRVSMSNGISLWPSVDVRGEERCHFWVRRGRVYWTAQD